LLISSHRDFLAAVLQPRATRATLARNPDYARVAEILNKQGIPDRCAWSFALTDEKYRPTYEMIRAGKMPVSRSVLGRILNAILVNEQTDRTVRQQAIDGKSLPEFDAVRRYLGPAGLIIATEPTGWFLKGFTLHKQPQ